MAKKKQTKKATPKKESKPRTQRKKCKPNEHPKEKEKLQARLTFLLDEVDDFWYGKRGKHSHINPLFNEYRRLVEIAKDLYKGNYIFEELDISEETQPNSDDLQVLEMDIEKMMVTFEMEINGSLKRLLPRLNMET